MAKKYAVYEFDAYAPVEVFGTRKQALWYTGSAPALYEVRVFEYLTYLQVSVLDLVSAVNFEDKLREAIEKHSAKDLFK